jgi:hypothetical protein
VNSKSAKGTGCGIGDTDMIGGERETMQIWVFECGSRFYLFIYLFIYYSNNYLIII